METITIKKIIVCVLLTTIIATGLYIMNFVVCLYGIEVFLKSVFDLAFPKIV